MKFTSPAKINLCLDVLEKTPSGLHKIQTIYQEIDSLFDECEILTTTKSDKASIVESCKKTMPTLPVKTENNLISKAITLVKNKYNINKNVQIIINKNIPFNSGLGGMSSNAAAVLKGLNKLWELSLSQKELLKLAEELGCDVPFFIIGGAALGTNFGEKITPLKPIKNISFNINKAKKWPSLRIDQPHSKTEKMYKSLDLSLCGKNKSMTEKLLKGIEKENKKLIIENLHNDFETIVKINPPNHLSGSGPATFTVN